MAAADEPTDADRVLRIRAGIEIVDHQLSQMLARLNANELRDVPMTRYVCAAFIRLSELRMAINSLAQIV
jgi:hypothetical protein